MGRSAASPRDGQWLVRAVFVDPSQCGFQFYAATRKAAQEPILTGAAKCLDVRF
jgi:hypothetical protein